LVSTLGNAKETYQTDGVFYGTNAKKTCCVCCVFHRQGWIMMLQPWRKRRVTLMVSVIQAQIF